MDQKKKVLILVLVLAVLMAGASVLYSGLKDTISMDPLSTQETQAQRETTQPEETAAAETSEPPRMMAPDFVVYDAQGEEVRLSDYFGKPIVLNFWASWCGPCQMEMPGFQEKYLELKDEVHFLMVNMTTGRETLETAQAFLEESGYTFPVFFDTQGDAAIAYGAYSLPMTFFIDADGYAIAQATGAIDVETLQRGIDMVCEPEA